VGSSSSFRGSRQHQVRAQGLETQIDRAEKLIYTLKSKIEEVDAKLDAVPLSNRAGKSW